jgi:hypothetical protein
MNDDISNTIEVLTARVKAKEEEVNKLKRLVNELCAETGADVPYPGMSEKGAKDATIRSDDFYGQTLTAAIRSYLERRKASGLSAASAADIYKAIKAGGYKFDTKNESNARVGVGNALRKTSSIFHRLPNGEYGLLTWYPTARAKPVVEPTKKRGKKPEAPKKPKDEGNSQPDKPRVTNAEIREIVLSQQGNFKTSDIVAALKAKFSTKELPEPKTPQVIFDLKKTGLIKEISPRTGSTPAVYAKG